MSTTPYSLLVGVGTLYVAPAGTAKPALTATPSGSWRSLGLTDGGVKVTKNQTIVKIRVDQSTGARKAVRTEEGVLIETSLAEATLENLADITDVDLTDTPAGSGTIGTRSIPMYKGSDVTTYALLFRGISAYGDWPGQYYVPVGFFDGDIGAEYKKDKETMIPVKFDALEDPNAASDSEKHGIFEHQDAVAL